MAIALFAASPAMATPVDRLVIGMEPGNADTNLYWETASDVSLSPALGRRVANDAETGAYSSDGLARSWEANDDRTEWIVERVVGQHLLFERGGPR